MKPQLNLTTTYYVKPSTNKQFQTMLDDINYPRSEVEVLDTITKPYDSYNPKATALEVTVCSITPTKVIKIKIINTEEFMTPRDLKFKLGTYEKYATRESYSFSERLAIAINRAKREARRFKNRLFYTGN